MCRPLPVCARRALTLGIVLATASSLRTPAGPERHTASEPGCSQVPRDYVVTAVGGASLPHKFERCAVVGSGGSLKSTKLGREIDDHDTVVRLNRLPSADEDPALVGRRTDVYFKNTLGDYEGKYVKVRFAGKETVWQLCELSSGAGCSNFTSLMFEGFWPWSPLSKAYAKQFQGFENRTGAIPLAYQSEALQIFEHFMPPRLRLQRPSCGMKAIFTLALLCESLDAYGFGEGGDFKTIDGHRLSTHNFAAEHAFQNLMAEGLLGTEDWTPVNSTGLGLLREKRFPEELTAFRSRLMCMGKLGRIRFH